MLRKLKREVAHRNMKKKGYTLINKKTSNGSLFSQRWREFC